MVNKSLSVARIDYIIGKMVMLKDNIDDASKDIVSTLVDKGEVRANELNALAPQSGTEKSRIITNIDDNGYKGTISLVGRNAVYDEFGTGEEGLKNSHPMKSKFPLSPYNSGPKIHYSSNYGYYWFYNPMAGEEYFTDKGLTKGIPAGKQIYETSKYVESISKKVAKECLDNATKSLKNI